MRRYARIAGGKVAEIFDRDPEGIHHPDIVAACVPCDDDSILENAAWDGVNFTNDPAVTAAIAQAAQDRQDAADVKGDGSLRALVAMSPAQIDAWATANINNLADARIALAKLAKIVSVLARRTLR